MQWKEAPPDSIPGPLTGLNDCRRLFELERAARDRLAQPDAAAGLGHVPAGQHVLPEGGQGGAGGRLREGRDGERAVQWQCSRGGLFADRRGEGARRLRPLASFVMTHRVAWLNERASSFPTSSPIWTIDLRMVAASSFIAATRAGSSKMPHGT